MAAVVEKIQLIFSNSKALKAEKAGRGTAAHPMDWLRECLPLGRARPATARTGFTSPIAALNGHTSVCSEVIFQGQLSPGSA